MGVKGFNHWRILHLSTLTLWLKNLISNSCYCLPCNSYDGQFLRLKNLVLDQQIILSLIFFFILISASVVLTFVGRLAQKIFPFLSSSHPIQFKTWNNQDLINSIFQCLILLHFMLSSHWLPVIFSFVLIGLCND